MTEVFLIFLWTENVKQVNCNSETHAGSEQGTSMKYKMLPAFIPASGVGYNQTTITIFYRVIFFLCSFGGYYNEDTDIFLLRSKRHEKKDIKRHGWPDPH